MRRAALALALLVAAPSLVLAGAWTRDQGHFYLNTSYSRIAATSFFSPGFNVIPIAPYEQHVLGFYGEVGVISRWLTLTLDGTLYRRNILPQSGFTEGIGDFRVGTWTGLLDKPVRLSLGWTVGIPVGDPRPSAGPNARLVDQQTAATLPTGDGEWDVEARLALGYAFGGYRRWPLQHYLVAEAGFWFRTAFANSFVWRFELGVKFPWTFIKRFWFMLRFNGVESFASNEQAADNATGLGNGVTFISPGGMVYFEIWKGLGVSAGVDSAVRARSLPAAAQLMFNLSYQY
jgi:hypothetical protein